MRRGRADVVRVIPEDEQVVVVVGDGRGDCAVAESRPRRPRRGDVPVLPVPLDDGEEREVAGVGRIAPEVLRDEGAVRDPDDVEPSVLRSGRAEGTV